MPSHWTRKVSAVLCLHKSILFRFHVQFSLRSTAFYCSNYSIRLISHSFSSKRVCTWKSSIFNFASWHNQLFKSNSSTINLRNTNWSRLISKQISIMYHLGARENCWWHVFLWSRKSSKLFGPTRMAPCFTNSFTARCWSKFKIFKIILRGSHFSCFRFCQATNFFKVYLFSLNVLQHGSY